MSDASVGDDARQVLLRLVERGGHATDCAEVLAVNRGRREGRVGGRRHWRRPGDLHALRSGHRHASVHHRLLGRRRRFGRQPLWRGLGCGGRLAVADDRPGGRRR